MISHTRLKSVDDAFKILQDETGKYMTPEVLEKVELEKVGRVIFVSFFLKFDFMVDIYYIGLPHNGFKDYKRLTQEIFKGELLEKIQALEPNVNNNINNQRSKSRISANKQNTLQELHEALEEPHET